MLTPAFRIGLQQVFDAFLAPMVHTVAVELSSAAESVDHPPVTAAAAVGQRRWLVPSYWWLVALVVAATRYGRMQIHPHLSQSSALTEAPCRLPSVMPEVSLPPRRQRHWGPQSSHGGGGFL